MPVLIACGGFLIAVLWMDLMFDVQVRPYRPPGAIPSILLLVGPVALAQVRIVPNAVRLGSRTDPAPVQSALARAVFRDHLLCLAAVTAFLIVQLAPIWP